MERTRGDGGRWALELGGRRGLTQVQSGRLHESREGRVCTQMHSVGEMRWRCCVVVLCRCFHFLDEIRSSILIWSQDGRERTGGLRRRKCAIAGAKRYLSRMGSLKRSRSRKASHFARPPLKTQFKGSM